MPSETAGQAGRPGLPNLAATPTPPETFNARFSDGHTAATRHVLIEFDPAGLVLRFVAAGAEAQPGAGGPKHWGYASLSSARPVHKTDGDVLLRSKDEPAATLFVVTPGFASALLKRAPGVSVRAERWRYLKPSLAILGSVAACALVVWGFNLSPSRAIAELVPHQTWRIAGQRFASTFEKDYPGCTSLRGRDALDRLVKRLEQSSGAKTPFEVRVANWSLVNAFAMPGSQIMLTRGLIRGAQSPEEVAGVLAHEMGHVTELHPETGIVRAVGLMVGLKLLLAGTPDAVQNISGLLLQLRYTRDAERQADARAFEILRKARISPKPLGAFFTRMKKREGGAKDNSDPNTGSGSGAKSGPDLSIFQSHPALAERADAVAKLPDYATEPILSAEDWDALRDICGKLPIPRSSPSKPDPAPSVPAPAPKRDPGKSI